MATMRPAAPKFDKQAQNGREDVAFELLRKNLPDDAIVIYESPVLDRRGRTLFPDFILLHPSFGVAVLEVKHWKHEKIIGADSANVTVRIGDSGMKMAITHPFKQVRQHAFAIQDQLVRDLAADPGVVRRGGAHEGTIAFPIPTLVGLMGTTDDEVPGLVAQFQNTLPAVNIITEETLENPDRLMKALIAAPRAFKAVVLAESTLQRIADAIRPEGVTDTQQAQAVVEKRDALRPRSLRELSTPVDGEDDLARYRRLSGDLLGVATDLHQLIDADLPGGIRAQQVERIRQAVERDEFQVGLFGETAAGKSTFVNALFGRKLLVQGLGETTKTLTRIRRPESGNPDRITNRAVVHYKTLAAINEETYGYLGLTPEYERETFTLDDAATRAGLKAMIEKPLSADAPQETKDAYKFIAYLLKGWNEAASHLGKSAPMSIDESTALCGREDQAVFIQSRDVFVEHPFTEDRFVFVDSPGVGSSLQRHSSLAVETARDMDAAVMVVNAKRPLMAADVDFLARVRAVRSAGATDNYVFALNQISTIDPDDLGKPDFDAAVDHEVDRLRERLVDIGIKDQPICPTDALCALLAQLVTHKDGCDAQTKRQWAEGKYCLVDRKSDLPNPEANLQASRFPALMLELKRFLAKTKTTGFLNSRRGMLLDVAEEFQRDIQKEIDGFNVELESIESEQRNHEKARERADRKIRNLLEHEMDSKMTKACAKLADEIKALVEEKIPELLHAQIRKHYKFMVNKRTNVIWTTILGNPEFQHDIKAAIENLRAAYHIQYAKIRDEAHRDLTEDVIVSAYGKDIRWRYAYQERPLTESKAYGKISQLRPGILADIKVGLEKLGNWIADQMAKVKILCGGESNPEDFFNIVKTVACAMNENYRTECAEAVQADVVDWIDADQQHFTEITLASFDELMGAIDQGIQQRRENREEKLKVRESRQDDLKHFRREIDRTLEKLSTLNREIAKLNPR